jgi:predicted DNA binding CopG/RHH family protein
MRKQYDFSGGKRGAAVPSPGKTRITIMLDDDLLEFFRSKAETDGSGYQTMINAALRKALPAAKAMKADDRPVTISTLRKILREELKAGSGKRAA